MDYPTLLQNCAPGVAASTMRAIVSVESAQRPHAIGYLIRDKDGKRFHLVNQPGNVAEAKAWARWLLDSGYRFDAGAAQVNSINFARFGLSIDNVFDACTNIRAGSVILQECYTRAVTQYSDGQKSLQKALSCYQAGDFSTGFRTGYVKQVTDKAIRYESESRPREQHTLPSTRIAGDQRADATVPTMPARQTATFK